jgi:cysteine desulfurase
MNADGVTVSAHKMGGPKGVAALAFREGCISQIFFGGGQEFELRPGTHNVPAILGFSAVVKENEKGKEKNAKKVSAIKEKFWKMLQKEIPRVERNELKGKKNVFLPHILSFRAKGVSAEEIIIALSLQGIFISAGSACSARHTSVPRAVRALWGEERAKESVRVSFSSTTTNGEIVATVRALKKILAR